MEYNTSCPACGAVLTLESSSERVTCEFCGNRFTVDNSNALPALERVIASEMVADPLPVQSALTESAEPAPPPLESLHAETLPPFRPPEPANIPAFTPSTRSETAAQKSRFPVWIIIALGVFLLVCGACGLMALLSIIPAFGGG